MIFWIITLGLACAVALILGLAVLWARVEQTPSAAFDLQVYRDQLSEVERDLERGVIQPDDATRVKTEISRRILAADAALKSAQGASPASTGNAVFAAVIALGVVAGSAGLYRYLGAPGYGDLALVDRIAQAEMFRQSRPSQASAEASIPDEARPVTAPRSEDYLALVKQLRGVVAERPNDVEGHRLLAVSETNLGNLPQAHQAFARYIALRGPAATGAEYADLADMLILAAGGYVSPDAETALERALELDPANGPARYYWGLMLSQTGRPDQAFQIWDRLLRQGPADASWIPPIQAQIEQMALLAGVNYAMPEPGGLRGPSRDDINAAGEMTSAERLEMIEGMVSGLSDRLATEGGTVQEWAQLITALGVLGRWEDARLIYTNALEAFAEDPAAIDHINRAGEQAGIAN